MALAFFRQNFFIPAPPLTEKNVPSQSGRVFIVTGGYAGVGKELSSILYAANGTVYIAGRNESKATAAIDAIKQLHPTSDGRLEFLRLDLADLSTIKPAVESFTAREQRLDVLTNNAGVMVPPPGSKDAHGRELQLGTNCLGPFLLTHLLTPLLVKTAASSPKDSVRVTWAASIATVMSPRDGVKFDNKTGGPVDHSNPGANYAQTKAGNVLLAQTYHARHHGKDGVVSNAWNPGNLASELQRTVPWYQRLMIFWMLHPPLMGAYTELYAGWGEGEGVVGGYVVPWGHKGTLRADLVDSVNRQKFWDWCEKETAPFA